MAQKSHSEEVLLDTVAAMERYGGISQAARAIGVPRTTFESRYYAAERAGYTPDKKKQSFTVHNPPGDVDEPIESILDRKRSIFARRARTEDETALLRVSVNMDGPYGILHMGDPHLDDDACDFAMLEKHIALIDRTEGLFGANVGDLSNNWIGRLARLYANQATTAAEAVKLIEWFVNRVKWLYLVGGNHDVWSGAADPVRWFSKQAGIGYKWHGVRLALTSPNGREIRVNARHDFAGTSQWNGAHAPAKAARLSYAKDHIYTCGHRHAAAHNMLVWENGEHVAHAVRVGTYKVFDDFSDAKGFPRENLPAAVTVVSPDAERPTGLVTVFWDVEEAASYLSWLRGKRSAHHIGMTAGQRIIKSAGQAKKSAVQDRQKTAKPAARRR